MPTSSSDEAVVVDSPPDAAAASAGTQADSSERRLAAVRTDRWLEFGDGIYRFALPMAEIMEVERVCSRQPEGISLVTLYGAIAAGRYELDGKSVAFATEGRASPVHLRHIVRLALVGGGVGIVDGKAIPVSPEDAMRLMNLYLDPAFAPTMRSWDIAFAVLSAVIEGREATPEECEHGRKSLVPPGYDVPIGIVGPQGRAKLSA